MVAIAFDLKVFFGVIDKDPADVVTADVLAFIKAQREPRLGVKVVRIGDGESRGDPVSNRQKARRPADRTPLYNRLEAVARTRPGTWFPDHDHDEPAAARARRYLTTGRVLVTQVDRHGVIAHVVGDAGLTYRCEHSPDLGWTCTCPASSAWCPHLLAVRLVTPQPVPAAPPPGGQP